MDKLVSSLFTSLGLRKGMRKEREKIGIVFCWQKAGRAKSLASTARRVSGRRPKDRKTAPHEMLASLLTTVSPLISQHNGHLDEFCETPL